MVIPAKNKARLINKLLQRRMRLKMTFLMKLITSSTIRHHLTSLKGPILIIQSQINQNNPEHTGHQLLVKHELEIQLT